MSVRVLHLISTLGSGGAERQLSLLAPAMAERGVQCHVVFAQGGQNLGPLQNSSVVLHQLQKRRNHDPRIIFDLWKLIRSIRPALVQTWLLQMDVMGGIAAMAAKTPHLLSERSSAAMYQSGLKMYLRSWIGRHADAIVANSQGGLDYWRSQRATGATYVVRNCISPSSQIAPTDDLGLSDAPLLLFAGRLSYEKNLEALIGALNLALKQLPGYQALLLGEGPLEAELKTLVKHAGLEDRVHFGGYSCHLGYWFRRAELFVSVSHFEGNPNVVIEAAAAGCPLILSDIPAHREAIGNSAALFSPPDNCEEIARLIIQSVNDRPESRQRALLAQAATAELTLNHAVDRYLSIYDDVMRA